MAVASTWMQQGRMDEAEKALRAALQHQERALGSEDMLTLNTTNELSVLLSRESRYAGAVTFKSAPGACWRSIWAMTLRVHSSACEIWGTR